MGKPSEVVTEMFGSNVFNDSVMRERLPKDVYKSLKKNDIKQWLQSLDRTSIDEINGFERTVFNTLAKKVLFQSSSKDDFIESVDPENGIRLIIPEIDSDSDLLLYPLNDYK